MRRSLQAALLSLLLVGLAACGGGSGGLPPLDQAGSALDTADALARSTFSETWGELSSTGSWIDGSSYGRWSDQWNGYGSIGVQTAASGDALALSPSAVTPYDHSALVTSTAPVGNFSASVALTTTKQLSAAQNPWEVGWVLWGYTDNTHFYAFTPQPNGWELSKEDPAYPGDQRFLATGSSPTFPVGGTYVVQVTQSGTSMAVSVNGRQIVKFTDAERPYTSGSLGLYSEEATVMFGAIAMVASK